MRFSTCDTSVGDLSITGSFSGISSIVEEDTERIHWDAARLKPDKSETEPVGPDAPTELVKVPPTE